jgi:hypothetical protein
MNRSALPSCLGIAALLLLTASPCLAQTGVCCFPDCACLLTTEEDCYNLGGNWLGELYDSCVPNPCDCPPGACCFPDGSCEVGWEIICRDLGGEWQADLCDPNPCPQPGACCFVPAGACVQLQYWDCVLTEDSHVWLPDVECDPNPCPMCICDACCLADGTCMNLDHYECEQLGGQRFGLWVDCNPNPCDFPPGACCFETGQCVVLAEEDCSVGPGAYAWFEGLSCDPDPCFTSDAPDIPGIQEATWGEIKSVHR